MKRPQGQQGQRTNGKAQFNGRPRFNSDKVHFNQDREAAGNRMHGKRPPLKKAYNAGYNSQAGSNGGHHGPKHQGGSLEELLMGNYKGKHFDPTKSRKYTALAAYFQRSGQSATGALPSSSRSDGASGNTILPLQDLQGLPPQYHNFDFALTIEGRGAELNDMDPVLYSDEGHDIEMEEVEPQQVLRYCDTQLMLEQEGRIINRVMKTADYVADLETLNAGQFRTQTRIDPKEYNARRAKHLDKISSTINGFTEHDVEVPIHIL